MNFRPGTPDDTESAVEVWAAANAARLDRPPFPPEEERRVRKYIGQPDSFLVVAEDGDEIVGMALGMQGRDVESDGSEIPGLCHIGAVFVLPERWGGGVGKGLVSDILEEARARNYTRTQLWTHEDNVRAQRLYERKGFRKSGRTATEEYGETIVHYERDLRGSK